MALLLGRSVRACARQRVLTGNYSPPTGWMMRRNLWWAVLVVAVALIQTTWLKGIRVQGVLPDLTLLLVVYFAIAEGEERAMFTGALGGVCQDVASSMVLGHHVLCNVVVGFVVGRVARRLIMEHPVVKVALVLCASLLNGLLFTSVEYVQTPSMSALHRIMTTVVPGAFYTALVTPLVFIMLGRAFRKPEETPHGPPPKASPGTAQKETV